MAWKVSADPLDFEEAIAWFRKRVPMSKAEREARAKADARHAAHVASAAHLDLTAQAFAAIKKAAEKGTTLEEFKKDVAAQVKAAWGRDDPWRIETIFRTNVQGAYAAGRYRQAKDPDVLADRPVWMFDAILDDRTTSICKACDGTKLPADDAWWKGHLPPLHHNCRSGFITLTEDQAGKLTLLKPTAKPKDGFGAEPKDEPTPFWMTEKLASSPAPLARIAAGNLPPPPPPPGGGDGGGGDGKKPKLPWHTDGKKRPPGKILDAEKFDGPSEVKIAEYLAADGNEVRGLPQKHKQVGHTRPRPDAAVNGVAVEFKTVSVERTEAFFDAVRRAAGRSDGFRQAAFVVVDVRGTGLSKEDVAEALRRGRDRLLNRIDAVRILGDGYDVTITELSWP